MNNRQLATVCPFLFGHINIPPSLAAVCLFLHLPAMDPEVISQHSLDDPDMATATFSFLRRPIGLVDLRLGSFESSFEALQGLRSRQETVDLVLSTADGFTEPVHSYYLALKAPKFWAQMAQQVERVRDSGPESSSCHVLKCPENVSLTVPRVLVADISGPMLKVVVSSLYRGAMQLDVSMSWRLLALAHKFELDLLADACLNFLAGTLSVENCTRLMQVALKFGHPLAGRSYRFLVGHFSQVVTSKASLSQLSPLQLRTLLADDDLNVANELYAWSALVAWIEHSPQERIGHFWSLFPLVRWQLMHSSMFPKVLADFTQLDTANEMVLSQKKTLKALQWPISTFNPRVPHTLVFLYGGYECGLPSSTLKTFDIRSGKCFAIDFPAGPARVHHATVALCQKLFILGGSNGLQVLSSMFRFNPATGRFRDCPPMAEPRAYLCSVRYRHFIVAIGGNNGTERLRSCELYDSTKKSWHRLPPMNAARSDASAAVLNDKIYVSGGLENFALSSVEFFSFETRSWTIVSFLNIPRRGHVLLAHGNALFAIGGSTGVDEYTCLRSVEKMTVTTGQWQFVAPLQKPRSSLAACILEDKLFVFGGYNGFSSYSSVECYAHRHSGAKWETVSCLLGAQLSATSAVTLSGLSCALHYSYYGQCLLQPRDDLPRHADPQRKPQKIARRLVAKSKTA